VITSHHKIEDEEQASFNDSLQRVGNGGIQHDSYWL